MSRPKVTPWFPAKVMPVHPGVYQTNYGFLGFSRWDGERWMDSEDTIEDALRTKLTGVNEKPWRGLASDPEATK